MKWRELMHAGCYVVSNVILNSIYCNIRIANRMLGYWWNCEYRIKRISR